MNTLDGVPVLSTSRMNARLGFTASSDFFEKMGIEPAVKTGTGIYWYERDFPIICFAIARYLAELTDGCHEKD